MHVETEGIELGDWVRDRVTGVEGVVSGVHQYLTGCARVSIQPQAVDGKVPEVVGADVLTVEVLGAGRVKAFAGARATGGPRNDPHGRTAI